ncbi:MAG TPA: GNAT family N-acetyltransferase [Castellaniella sp.]|nr:GNAT family N-acetyltransferase [Castellaniella sp.]
MRSLTDWSYACYLSDLAVDRDFQGMGIGRGLIELTREYAERVSMCLLVSTARTHATNRRQCRRNGPRTAHCRRRREARNPSAGFRLGRAFSVPVRRPRPRPFRCSRHDDRS